MVVQNIVDIYMYGDIPTGGTPVPGQPSYLVLVITRPRAFQLCLRCALPLWVCPLFEVCDPPPPPLCCRMYLMCEPSRPWAQPFSWCRPLMLFMYLLLVIPGTPTLHDVYLCLMGLAYDLISPPRPDQVSPIVSMCDHIVHLAPPSPYTPSTLCMYM